MVEENKEPTEEVVDEVVEEVSEEQEVSEPSEEVAAEEASAESDVIEELSEELAEEVAEEVVEEKPKLTEEQMAWRKKRMQKTEKVLLSNIALGKLKKLYPENIPMGAFELLTEEEKAKLTQEASKLRAKLDSLCSKIDAGEEVDCYCPKNWE